MAEILKAENHDISTSAQSLPSGKTLLTAKTISLLAILCTLSENGIEDPKGLLGARLATVEGME